MDTDKIIAFRISSSYCMVYDPFAQLVYVLQLIGHLQLSSPTLVSSESNFMCGGVRMLRSFYASYCSFTLGSVKHMNSFTDRSPIFVALLMIVQQDS